MPARGLPVRRLAALATVAAAALVALIGTAASNEGGGYRVDAIFDNAAQLIPGQDVKIAGARVGKVVAVTLTDQRKARIQMEVDRRFAPFRSDADCTIQPQSLIGEKFIQCAPGTPRGRPLARNGEDAPTVPLSGTHSPVDLDLVFGTFRLPYRQRLALLVNELGAGLAGRSEDLNEAIRRANPALAEANRVLAILDRDRARLGTLVAESDEIIGELAGRRGRVADFIDRAAAVTGETAARRTELARTVHRLPPLLAEARPTLRRLRELSDAGAPLLASLRRAAPQVQRLVRDLGPLATAARPALDRLGEAAVTGRRAVRVARPVVARLRTFAAAARPTGALVAELFASMRQRGVVEGLQSFVYYAAAATSRFDEVSHLIPAHVISSECQQYATTPVPGCSAHFGGVPVARASSQPPRAAATAPAAATAARRAARPPGADPAGRAMRDLLGYLLS